METAEYHNLFRNENDHFYYRTTHELIETCVRRLHAGPHPRVLDAGCGTGGLTLRLSRFADVVGIDASPVACELATERGVPVREASVTALPFPANSFDIVTSVDVIYHRLVDDEREALREFARVLKPGGWLIVRVPANPWLRSSHDRHVHTRRRFSRRQLRTSLASAGLVTKKISPLGMVLMAPALVQHFRETWFPRTVTRSGVTALPNWINRGIMAWMRLENRWVTRTTLPFGLGLLACAQKPVSQPTSGELM